MLISIGSVEALVSNLTGSVGLEVWDIAWLPFLVGTVGDSPSDLVSAPYKII